MKSIDHDYLDHVEQLWSIENINALAHEWSQAIEEKDPRQDFFVDCIQMYCEEIADFLIELSSKRFKVSAERLQADLLDNWTLTLNRCTDDRPATVARRQFLGDWIKAHSFAHADAKMFPLHRPNERGVEALEG